MRPLSCGSPAPTAWSARNWFGIVSQSPADCPAICPSQPAVSWVDWPRKRRKRIVAEGGLSQFSHPGRRPPSDGAPVCWRSPSYRGGLRHLIRFPRGKSRQDWPRAPSHQLLRARSTAELSSDFLMYRCVRARTSTGSWQVKRIEQTTPAPQGRDLQRVWLLAERAAWAFGLAALAIWGVVNLAGVEGTREDLARFEALPHARLHQRGVFAEQLAP